MAYKFLWTGTATSFALLLIGIIAAYFHVSGSSEIISTALACIGILIAVIRERLATKAPAGKRPKK